MGRETSIPGGSPFPSLRALTGTVIDGRYEIGKLLGCGGMGAVYEAMQLRLDRRVAIKILNPVYMHRDDYVARFMREAKAASRIRHENVVQVLDFGELPGGSVYSVMEFLEGRDLAQLLQDEIKLPWPRTRALLMQMARGLKAAHAEGVIHRDIKPANLFLVPNPEEAGDLLKVLDFGIARLQTSTSHTAGLTGTAELLGTPSYMAPELARGRAADPRSEIYSVGVVAYRIVTGHLPFDGDTAFDVLFRSATEPAPPLRTHDPTVPAAIEALILRMLAKDPEDRLPDMATLYRAVAAIDDAGRLRRDEVTLTGPQPPVTSATPVVTEPLGSVDRTRSGDPAARPAITPTPSAARAAPTPPTAEPISPPVTTTPAAPSTIEANAPQVVVPPPLSVSPSTRAAISASRAARAGVSSPSMQVDDDAYELDERRAARPGVPRWLLPAGLAFVGIVAIAASRGDDTEHASSDHTRVITAAAVVPDEADATPGAPMHAPARADAEAEASAIVVSDENDEDAADAVAPEPAPESVPSTLELPPTPSTKSDPERASPSAQPKPRPKAEPVTPKPRTDAQVIARLRLNARRKCGKLLGGEPLSVTFGIGDNGRALASRADRGGVAAKCVLALVDDAQFAAGKMRKGVLEL